MNTNGTRSAEPLIGEEALKRADQLLETAVRKVVNGSSLPDWLKYRDVIPCDSPYGGFSKTVVDGGMVFRLESVGICRAELLLRNLVVGPESGIVETRAVLEFWNPSGLEKSVRLPSLYIHVDTYKDDVRWFYNTVLSRPLASYIGTAWVPVDPSVIFVDIDGNPLEIVPGWTDKYEEDASASTLELAVSQECESAVNACVEEHGARFTGSHSFLGARNV